MDETLVTIVRSVIAFLSLLIFTRILGKQQVGQLTAFEYVAGISIGSMASSLSIDLSIKPLPQYLGLATWVILVFSLQFISIKNRSISKLVNDQATIVIQNGKILEGNLRKLRYRHDELLSHLREKDVFDITQVEFALLEPNGNLSVLKKAQFDPVTPNDLQLPPSQNGLITEVILDGKIIVQNLNNRDKDLDWLQAQLTAQGADVKNVSFAAILPNNQLYIDRFEDKLKDVEIGDYKGPF